MVKLDWNKFRIFFICLSVLMATLAIFFRENYRIFAGFFWMFVGITSICSYFLIRKETGKSSKLSIFGVIFDSVLCIYHWMF